MTHLLKFLSAALFLLVVTTTFYKFNSDRVNVQSAISQPSTTVYLNSVPQQTDAIHVQMIDENTEIEFPENAVIRVASFITEDASSIMVINQDDKPELVLVNPANNAQIYNTATGLSEGGANSSSAYSTPQAQQISFNINTCSELSALLKQFQVLLSCDFWFEWQEMAIISDWAA